MTGLSQDVRHAIRLLARNPGFTLIVMLALALGVGSITTTFSVAETYLLRPLPFREPDRLVHVWETDRKQGWDTLRVSVPNFLDWRDQLASFEDLAAFNYTVENLTGGTEPEEIAAARVSANAFRVLGVEPVLGRGFADGEDATGRGDVVVLAHRFWQTRFGDDPAVLGRTLEIGERAHTIVGVMPPEFVFPLPTTQFWIPRELDTAAFTRDRGLAQVVGRLQPGVTMAQAQTELDGLMRRLEGTYPEIADRGANVVPLRAALNFAYDILRVMSVVLLAANLFVLLIACANISILLLGRGLARTREAAIRFALGAWRGRLVRQFLVESVVLALAGAAAGLLFAVWGTGLAAASIPDDLYRVGEVTVSGPALIFSLAVSLFAALAFGLLPALRSSGADLAEAVRQGSLTTTATRGTLRLQTALVVGQVGFSVMLLTGTALLIRSYQNLQRADVGFDARNVATMRMIPPASRYDSPERVEQFHQNLLREASRVPGVTAVATVNYLPLNHETNMVELGVPGRDVTRDGRAPSAVTLTVSPDYFTVLRVPLRAGRAFTDADRLGAAPVVIVNEALAARLWPNADPVGQRITLKGQEVPFTIVGVVGDTKHQDIAERPASQVYLAQYQFPWTYLRLVARAAGDPAIVAPSLARAVWRVDGRLPVTEIRSLEQVVAEFLLPQRALSTTLVGLALGSLLLAIVGLYGVLSFFVARRTREIGIRMALGAAPTAVIAMVVRRGLALTAIGLAIGLAGAFGLGQVMSSLLFGVSGADPLAFAIVATVLLLVAAAACYVPARRAARVDPLMALRAE